MNRGKNICKELKAVRKQIAEENGIPLEIPECTYKGPCKGTCPRCESEVRYLENALAERLRIGKVASVAGIALTLASPAVATAQSADSVTVPPSHERQTGMCELTGVVVDARSREPLPFVSVMLYKDTTKAMVVQTDFDGRYHFSVRGGRYDLEVKCVGYNTYRREVVVKRSKENQGVMELVFDRGQYDTYGSPKVDTVEMTAPMMGLVETVYMTEGTVMDGKTKEPIPFANVVVLKDRKQVMGTTTGFDGNFKLELEDGTYEILISSIGYAQKRIPVKVPQDMPLEAIMLEPTATTLEGMVRIIDSKVPLIDVGAPGQVHGIEVDGVQVRVQY